MSWKEGWESGPAKELLMRVGFRFSRRRGLFRCLFLRGSFYRGLDKLIWNSRDISSQTKLFKDLAKSTLQMSRMGIIKNTIKMRLNGYFWYFVGTRCFLSWKMLRDELPKKKKGTMLTGWFFWMMLPRKYWGMMLTYQRLWMGRSFVTTSCTFINATILLNRLTGWFFFFFFDNWKDQQGDWSLELAKQQTRSNSLFPQKRQMQSNKELHQWLRSTIAC